MAPASILSMALLAACAPAEGHPPVARASADPGVIPENDGFQTPVTLDATASADPIDDPDGDAPLEFQWRIRGDEHRFEGGDERSPTPTVHFRGDRPATVELEVTDSDGLSSRVSFQLTLTVGL